MRVLFVFPDLASTITNYTGVLSYGVASLAAVLRRDGHEVELLHLVEASAAEEFQDRVRAARPDLVAFSANSHYARRLRAWAAWARAASDAPAAVGGIHATLAPEDVATIPEVDFVCVGEGEDALSELCRALERGTDPGAIPNLWVRRGTEFTRNAPRPVQHDLDALPDPDLSVFDVQHLYPVRQGTFTYLMSRGCAYGCTYCCVHTLRRIAPRRGRYWRFLSPQRAADQLARLIARHSPEARDVSFVDAILYPDREWLAAFAPLYRRRVGLPFSCNMRADLIDGPSAALLREMGCRIVRLGVESGDERMTRDVLRRSLDIEDIRRAFAVLREHGIQRWSYNMVGLPTETLRTALKTVRLNAQIDPDLALAFIFYPYPGTELHRLCGTSGYLTEREFDHYQVDVAIRMPQFARPDILFVHRFFRRLVRVYGFSRRLPAGLRDAWMSALDVLLAGPLFPRRALLGAREGYRKLRHRTGELLVRRAPALYRLLGGRAPAWRVGDDRGGVVAG
ncbi:MAG: hypothetical protein A2W00_03060 [Candidatus Eisenbacteria bacterium RBG_16_71_46]|nr:MAG: hypothetical protein A2W00_03060 [Candidatus Eisenbacteria bacterium RBG_16_71_46]